METSIKNSQLKKWAFALFFPIDIIYTELILRITISEHFFGLGLLFIPLLSIPVGLFLTVLCTFFKRPKNNFIVAVVLSVLIFLITSTQIVYHTCFNQYLMINSITQGGIGQVTEHGGFIIIGLKAILSRIIPIIFLALPIAALVFLTKKNYLKFYKINIVRQIIGAIGGILLHFIILLLVLIIPVSNEVYFGAFNPSQMVSLFGLATTERLDIKYNLFHIGSSGNIIIDNSSNTEKNDEPEKATEYGDNVMNIDFSSLIANESNATIKSLHQYFSNQQPTKKNEYTGMFEGYNLIMLTAEGFYPYAIDKNLTPTLYKMQQEGFNFVNYYNSPWAVSTSDGEYVECTGLIPKSGVWSFYESGKSNIFFPFTMSQQFLNVGVSPVYAYHNNTYSYYHRDVSHPNLGYIYKGLGNGLNVKKTWPESDLEMIEVSGPEYITADKRFHAYYMTVSGHMEYDFKNNYMSYKYKDYVKDLNYSEAIKAYIACNMDLDRAMENLLKQLEEAGVADKTLIALSPDHTPYGLEQTGSKKYELFDELFGHKVETQFEVNRSVFLLYSPSMEKGIKIDKVCSPLDIIPTLNNLLGFEYDSRLLPGKDIFSTSEGIAIFENHSFITDKGRYFAATGTFVKNDGAVIENESDYVAALKKEVNNKFTVCSQILTTNYYKKALLERTHFKGQLAQK